MGKKPSFWLDFYGFHIGNIHGSWVSRLLETGTWWRSLRAKPQRMERRRPASWRLMIRLMIQKSGEKTSWGWNPFIPLFTTGFIDVGWLALGFLNHQPYDDVFSRSESLLYYYFLLGGKGFMLVWSISFFFLWTIFNCKDFVFISSQFGSGKLVRWSHPSRFSRHSRRSWCWFHIHISYHTFLWHLDDNKKWQNEGIDNILHCEWCIVDVS